jgi:hypothetical protein
VLRLVQKGRGKVKRGTHTLDDDSYACRCRSAWSGYAASAPKPHQADGRGIPIWNSLIPPSPRQRPKHSAPSPRAAGRGLGRGAALGRTPASANDTQCRTRLRSAFAMSHSNRISSASMRLTVDWTKRLLVRLHPAGGSEQKPDPRP